MKVFCVYCSLTVSLFPVPTPQLKFDCSHSSNLLHHVQNSVYRDEKNVLTVSQQVQRRLNTPFSAWTRFPSSSSAVISCRFDTTRRITACFWLFSTSPYFPRSLFFQYTDLEYSPLLGKLIMLHKTTPVSV